VEYLLLVTKEASVKS